MNPLLWAGLALALVVIGLLWRAWQAEAIEMYVVQAPLAEDIDPAQLIRTLHGLLKTWPQRLRRPQPHLVWEITGSGGQINFQIGMAPSQRRLVRDLLSAAHPGLELEGVSGSGPAARVSRATRLVLAQPSRYPIRTERPETGLDPVWAALGRTGPDERLTMQILFRPRAWTWNRGAILLANRMRLGGHANWLWEAISPSRSLTTATPLARRQAASIEAKAAELAFTVAARAVAATPSRRSSRHWLSVLVSCLRVLSAENSIRRRPVFFPGRFNHLFQTHQMPLTGRFTLNAAELAGLVHLPGAPRPGLASVTAGRVPPPLGVLSVGRILGRAAGATGSQVVAQADADSVLHTFVTGATGSGKSTLLKHVAVQAMQAGDAVVVIDPGADLVTDLIGLIPLARRQDVILISPAESGWSLGLNPLEVRPGGESTLVADEVLAIIRHGMPEGWEWGIMTQQILQAALVTLARRPGSTLAHVPTLLTDRAYRAEVLRDGLDPALRGFWSWFEGLSDAQRNQAITAPLHRLRLFLLMPRVRRLLCQPHSTLDLRAAIDNRAIILADLNTAQWGEGASSLVGSILYSRLLQALRSRVDVPADRRPRVSLVIDEFARYVGYSASGFEEAVSQGRRLGLALYLATQHLGQLSRELREALSANARTRIAFQTGRDDAQAEAAAMAPMDAAALMNLPRFRAAVRLAISGQTSPAFTIDTLPPPVSAGVDPAMLEAAQRRHARPVAVVDQEILRSLSGPERPTPTGPVGRRPR